MEPAEQREVGYTVNRDEIIEAPDLVVLLHNYGMAVIAQATRPTDEGQTALGEAAIAIYAHVDAMVPLIRAQVAEELRAEAARLRKRYYPSIATEWETVANFVLGEPTTECGGRCIREDATNPCDPCQTDREEAAHA